MHSKLDHAISLANRGFCVFPLSPNSKVPPAGLKWRDESTERKARIEEWWRENPEYNIGIDTGKSGLYVIDVDTKQGKEGDKSYRILDEINGFPDTCTAITATGGRHLIYKTSEIVGNTASALGKDIDTRGWGGYIVGPGSIINGQQYRFADATPIMPTVLPGWVVESLKAYRERKQQSNRKDIISADNPADIERARKWLLDVADIAVEGRGGDATTFATAAKLREFGVSADTALELMLDHWNDRCLPPWHIEELQRKVENAYKYSNKAQGAASAQADFEPVIEEVNLDDFAPDFHVRGGDKVPPRDWVIPDIVLAKNVTVLTAPAGVGKSTLTMSIALSLASGKDFLGLGVKAPAMVMLQNNEDDMMELTRRMEAIAQFHGIHDDDLLTNDATGAAAVSRLKMQSGEKRALRIAQRTGGGLKPKDVDALVEVLIKKGIRLLIVDPFAETHPANENDNGEMLEIAKMFRDVAQRANCAVLLVHHDRKPDQASAEGHIGNMHSARGASALAGVARVMFTFHTMTERDCRRYGVAEEERRYYARLDNAKANMSFSGGAPIWFKRIGERIGMKAGDPDSGESVGVLASVKLLSKEKTGSSLKADMIKDIEATVIDAGNDGRPVAVIASELVAAFPSYNGKSPEAISRAVKRLFEDGSSLTTSKGFIVFYEREKQAGESARAPRQYIKWLAKTVE